MKKLMFDNRLAVSWVRWSSKKQIDKDSERRQIALYQEAIERTGATDKATFAASAKSAYKGAHIDDLSALVEFCKKQPERYIVFVEAIDRLTRLELDDAIELMFDMLLHVDVYVIESGDYYDRNSRKDLLSVIKFILHATAANEYSKRLSMRQNEVKKQIKHEALENGKAYNQGNYPKWLRIENGQFVVNEHDKTIINEVFTMYSQGLSSNKIANHFKGVKRSHGYNVSVDFVRRIIRNENVIGISNPQGIKVYPPIVSEDLWNKVQSITLNRNRTNNNTKTTVNLFTGLTKCVECGHAYNIYSQKGGKWHGLRCNGRTMKMTDCANSAFTYPLFEKMMLEPMFSMIEKEFFLFDNQDIIHQNRLKFSELENEVKELDLMLQDQANPPMALLKTLSNKNKELEDLKGKLFSEDDVSTDVDLTGVYNYENSDLRDRVRVIIAALVDHVELYSKGTRKDKQRAIRIHLKNGKSAMVALQDEYEDGNIKVLCELFGSGDDEKPTKTLVSESHLPKDYAKLTIEDLKQYI